MRRAPAAGALRKQRALRSRFALSRSNSKAAGLGGAGNREELAKKRKAFSTAVPRKASTKKRKGESAEVAEALLSRIAEFERASYCGVGNREEFAEF